MDDPLGNKSRAFAIQIIELYKKISTERREYVISKQILRSGTSIGANVSEAKGVESRADFIHKIKISQKEAHETQYWLELLVETEFLHQEQFNKMKRNLSEILKLIHATLKTAQKKN